MSNKSIVNILEELEQTSGSLAKTAILERESKNALLKDVFVAAFDPYTVYYVSKFKMPEAKPIKWDDESAWSDNIVRNFIEFITTMLATRVLTGNTAKEETISRFCGMSPVEQKWCQRILLHNLRCGVQASTINKVWPDLLKSFTVALADKLKNEFIKGKGIVLLEKVQYPVRVEPKLDGLRCVAIKSHGEVLMYTRNGTLLETVPRIKNALLAAQYDDIVLDGELMGADWNESTSVVMSKKNVKDDSNIFYNVFDAVPVDLWVNQDSDRIDPIEVRSELVADIIKRVAHKNVRHVPHVIINNEAELMDYFQTCTSPAHGYEGVMLKKMGEPYVFGRSRAMIKLKPYTTYEGVVVGWYEGRRGTQREGMFGGFNVVLQNGIVTNVGGGFNKEMFAQVALDGPDTYLGKIVEIEAQPDAATTDGLSKDGKARFPVFVRFRDESDVDPKVIAAGVRFFELVNDTVPAETGHGND